MLDLFKYIQNLGRFRQATGTDATRLRRLTLIYSENGRGKTTLCAILRSLTRGSSAPLLERKRLDNTDPTRVVLEIDGQAVSFNGAAWTASGPTVHIFDERFVDENVYSGLTVGPSHRQGIHELVLGHQGVQYQRRVEELTERAAALQAQITAKERAFPAELRHGLSVEEFCGLQRVEDIDSRIDEASHAVAVLNDTEPVRQAGYFQPFAVPTIELGPVETLLARTLADLDQDALEAVQAHVRTLDSDAERWISEGERLRGGSSSCPYCAQDISGSRLVSHYRAYFSDAYAEHKRRIAAQRSELEQTLGGDALASFGRALERVRELARFWARFISVPEDTVDAEVLAETWTALRDEMEALLEQKARAPLDPLPIPDSTRTAHAAYHSHVDLVRSLSDSLVDTREAIEAAQEQAGHGSLDAARAQFSRLKATKSRFTTEAEALCSDLQTSKAAKAQAEKEKEEARAALDEQRELLFGTYLTRMNQLLVRLNADFSIEELRPSDRGRKGAPSTTYALRVNSARVELATPEDPAPSFKTALSAGDRNTLALAFFFASLEGEDLSDAIVVVDDPASSLDSARSLKTVQQVRRVQENAHQVIVLSHSLDLLCRLWDQADHDNTATLQVKTSGNDASTVEPWDADAASETEHDRLFALVAAYGNSTAGNPQEVAPALRLLLESFLRVAFPEYFLPGEQLGTFVTRCKTKLDAGTPVLPSARFKELDEIKEYANLFHHSTNQTGYRQALATINEAELQAHARDTIHLIGKLRGSG